MIPSIEDIVWGLVGHYSPPAVIPACQLAIRQLQQHVKLAGERMAQAERREAVACFALQGLLANPQYDHEANVEHNAVTHADELIKELDRV